MSTPATQLETPMNTDLVDRVELDGGSYIDGMPNEDYHSPDAGFSTSNIKDLIVDPATVKWSREAVKDPEKLAALDFGTDFHAYFLEPEMFAEKYKVLPVFNRRKPDEKKAELEMIADWKKNGIIPVTHEDMHKLKAMRDSAMAHPTVAAIMKLGGVAERSYFWTDKKSGVDCKCRPDQLSWVNDENRLPFMQDDQTVIVMDVKTIGQIDQIQNQIERLKYWVQGAFYERGISQVTGHKLCFVFAFVSTTLSLGRYPVHVIELTDTALFDGNRAIDEALDTYQVLTAGDDSGWQTVQKMDRPSWAMTNEDLL